MRLLALAVVLAPAIAVADAPLTFTAATHGSTLDVTFKNTSTAPVTFTTHVRAGNIHHDDLKVTLTSPTGSRSLTFWESREKSAPIDETIKPGGSLTRSVDLAAWAIRGENTGGPLAAGTYEVAVAWEMRSGPKQKLRATTKLVLAGAKETGCTEQAGAPAALELLAHQEPNTAKVAIGLHNTDSVAHCVHGIIRTHETQNDWLSLAFEHAGKKYAIGFTWDRDKSSPVAYQLAPGATVWTTWDLAEWHKRAGGKPLPAKTALWITATWDAKRERGVWTGRATTDFPMRWP